MYMRGRPVTFYVPEKRADALNYDITKIQPAPSKKLKLDWVTKIKERKKFMINNWFFTFRPTVIAERTAVQISTNFQLAKLFISSQQRLCFIISTNNRSVTI